MPGQAHRFTWAGILEKAPYRRVNDIRLLCWQALLFQDTHKPLRLSFQAMWYVVNQKNGVSALGLQKALGLGSYHTAWEWLHKLRRAMVRPGRDRLSGIVEVDETFLGGKRRVAAWSRRQVLDFHCGGRSKRQRECNWPHSPFRAGKRSWRDAREGRSSGG